MRLTLVISILSWIVTFVIGADNDTETRDLSCKECRTDTPEHSTSTKKGCLQLGPKVTHDEIITHTNDVSWCHSCFLMHRWIDEKLEYEERGCFTTGAVPGNTCTIEYHFDRANEVWEVCRCNSSNYCNEANMTSLGGIGNIKKFPVTTTISSDISAAVSQHGGPHGEVQFRLFGLGKETCLSTLVFSVVYHFLSLRFMEKL